MVRASGTRIVWTDLPDAVRRGVGSIVGSPVVEAVSQNGGFSPGTADRVRTASGERAFVKACSPALNERTVVLHRREARVAAGLPPEVPAPRLLGVYDDGSWVALVFDDVPGRHPATPWRSSELLTVLAALTSLAGVAIPTELADLPTTAEELAEDLRGWHRVRADAPHQLDDWVVTHLDQLCDVADVAPAALAGDRLVHTDVRADNLLIRPDGTVAMVDWPWASRGPAWFDTLSVLINVATFGGHDVSALLAEHAPAELESAKLTAVLVAIGGYFLDAARKPAPAGLPTIRAFQAAQGAAVLPLIRNRLDGVAALQR